MRAAARRFPAPDVVLVLGMHRSGTSLATAILQDLGAKLSEDLVEPNEFNERGYFESASVMQIHDDILKVLGSSWRMPALTTPFPDQWWRTDAVAPYRRHLRRLIERQTAQGGTWAVKDPRCSRLLPLWNDLFDELAVQARYVLSYRAPSQVAASLHRRDGIARGLSDVLWLEHNADALRFSGERLACMFDYEAWFGNGEQQARSLLQALALPAASPALVRETVAHQVEGRLRHENGSEPSAVPFVDDLFHALRANDRARLDSLLDRYGQSQRLAAVAGTAQALEVRSEGQEGAALHDIHQRVTWREDVAIGEVSRFLDSTESAVRAIANIAVSRTSIRTALETIVAAAQAQDYSDPNTITAILRIMQLSDVDTPYIEMLKRIGIRSAASGADEQAMDLLEDALRRAFITGERPAAKSRAAFAYLDDAEIWAAIEQIAARFPFTSSCEDRSRLRIVCSSLRPASAGSAPALERARNLCALGFNVDVIATEPLSADADAYVALLEQSGAAVWQCPAGSALARVQAALERCNAHAAYYAIFMPDVQDAAARLLGGIKIASVQVWERRLFGPRCGAYDFVTDIAVPGSPGAYLALPGELDAAPALNRDELEIPDSALILATVGRYAKCAQPQYLEGVRRALAAVPEAYLLVSGQDEGGAFDLMRAYLRGENAENRFRSVEALQWRSALKIADVYCDTAPWNGEQALLAAMYRGLPVVAFSGEEDAEPVTARFARDVLHKVVPLAADPLQFSELVQLYARDQALRVDTGNTLREHARMHFDPMRASQLLKDRLAAQASSPAVGPRA